MKLENGYKIIYEARQRVTEEKPGPMYASKSLPSIEDVMLVSYDNGVSYVDCRQFKLIYSDGKHLLGSVSGKPAEGDINIVLKCGNEIVFGEVISEDLVENVVENVAAVVREVEAEPEIEEEPVEEIEE